MTDEKPALYCGTYGKYNDGSIAGKWLYLEDYADAEEFFAACRELHNDEDDPEFMFQDYEYLPKDMYSESLGEADVEKIYEYINLDADDREKVKEYWDEIDSSSSIDYILNDSYEGNINDIKGDSWMSDEEAYGYYYEESGFIDIPDHVKPYFDFEEYGKDMLEDATITESGFIFRSC